MKHLFLITLVSLFSLLGSSTYAPSLSAESNGTVMVYICMSENAYAYHRFCDCQSLKRATHPIKSVTIEDAIKKYGKYKACGHCYKN